MSKSEAKNQKADEAKAAKPKAAKPKRDPSVTDVGIATIAYDGENIMTITAASDGTFGWRTHGKITLVGRVGPQKAYKFRKGLASFEAAVAGALCFYARSFEVVGEKIAVLAYTVPDRGGFGGRKLEETPAYQAAAKIAKGLKLPPAVKKALASGGAQ